MVPKRTIRIMHRGEEFIGCGGRGLSAASVCARLFLELCMAIAGPSDVKAELSPASGPTTGRPGRSTDSNAGSASAANVARIGAYWCAE